MNGLFLAVLGLALALAIPAIASAATLTVAEDGTDDGDCLDDPCRSIGYAVAQAAGGDVVDVKAGNYLVEASIPVDTSITIRGAQAGVDARTRNVPSAEETVIRPSADLAKDGVPVIRLNAAGATVDGVTINGPEVRDGDPPLSIKSWAINDEHEQRLYRPKLDSRRK